MKCFRWRFPAALVFLVLPFTVSAQPLQGADPTVGSAPAGQASGGVTPGASSAPIDPQSQGGSAGATPAAGGAQQATSTAGAAAQLKYVLPGSKRLESLLGMTLAQAFTEFGPPEDVFPVRGQQAWEDDVVFYYPDHTYLFWFKNRVWQVRADRRYTSQVLGVSMGEDQSSVNATLGTPFWSDSDSEIFNIEDLAYRGYPIRARLFFTDGKLSDLYIYRADF